MTLLVFALVVVLLVALLVWAVTLLPLPAPFMGIVQFLVVLIGIVAVLAKTGIV